MSTVYFIVQQTMFFALPLLIVAMGAMYSERSGITNIALEGIMIIGAFAGICVIRTAGDGGTQGTLILGCLAAAAAGLLYSMLHAYTAIRLQADQIISGTALNMFAPAFCIFLARCMLGKKNLNFTDSFHIDKVPVLGDIPVIGPMFFQNCYLTTFIGILIFLILAFVIGKTRFGMRLSACGENPEAAAGAGIDVSRMRWLGVMISGVLGGIGGLAFILPTSTSFSGTVAGYGFLALAVLILGEWRSMGILPAAFFFGLLKAVSSSYSGIPILAKLQIPAEVYKIIPYILTLIVLAFSAARSKSPEAVGIPYDDGKKQEKGGKSAWIRIIAAAAAILILVVGIARQFAVEPPFGISRGYGADVAEIVNAEGNIDDKGFSQGAWEGIRKSTDAYPEITRKYYKCSDGSIGTMNSTIDLAVKGNAKIIILPGFNYQIATFESQDRHPDTTFILIDGEPQNADGSKKRIGDNTICLNFAEEQSGFLAGYAAVMDGYRNLGFMGGLANPAVVNFGYGYVAGADYAAQELGLAAGDVQITYNYVGTYDPTPEAQTQAASWYRSGVEVIFASGGAMGNAVMKAAENNGGKVIGVDVDQSSESDTVITSAKKNICDGVDYLLRQYMDGTLPLGTSQRLTVRENAEGLPMETSHFEHFTQEQYDAIYQKMVDGEITIPNNSDAPSADKLKLQIVQVRVVE